MPTSAGEFVLDRKRLFMLPTRFGLVFAVVLLAMLLAAVNYQNGLAHAFTFLLAAVVLVSMLYTHRNLSGLRVTAADPKPVFAGESTHFPVLLTNPGTMVRPAVWLQAIGLPRRVDIPSQGTAQAEVAVQAHHRGYVECPILRVSTAFPFGLLYTWSHALRPTARGLVYPRPGPYRPLPESLDRRRYQNPGTQPDGDDFVGLRSYQPGDPPRHVHWKAAARGQGLLTKQFGGAAAGTVWLDWDATPGSDTETRLSQLCRWVLDAEQEGAQYGLRLPGDVVQPDHGVAHRHRCLAALALWNMPRARPDV